MAFGDIVQSVAAADPTTTLGAAPAVGNTLLWAWGGRSTSVGTSHSPTSGTWALIRREFCNANVAGDGATALYLKPVELGDPASWPTHVISSGDKAYLFEIEGLLTADDDAGASSVNGVDPTVVLNPTPGLPAVLVSLATFFTDGLGGFPAWATPVAGMTELLDTGAPAPCLALNIQVVALTSGSYTVGSTGSINPFHAFGAIVAVALVGAPPPPGPGIDVDIYDPDGVHLATLNDAFDKVMRAELKGQGQGSFKINRYSPGATAANLRQGNLVTVTYTQISPFPIFAFFLETGNFDLISTDESGGEDLTFAGAGARSYLKRARMWDRSYITTGRTVLLGPRPRWILTKAGGVITGRVSRPFNPVQVLPVGPVEILDWPSVGAKYQNRPYVPITSGTYAGKYVDARWLTTPYVGEGTWRLFASSTGSKPGQILRRIIAEAQVAGRPQHPIAGMAVDFDYTTDSNGDAWASSDATAEFTAQIGEELDAIVQRLIDTGAIDVQMEFVVGTGLVLRAFNAYGRDLHSPTFAADKVRFEKGVNIADVLRRSVGGELPATHILVDGDDNVTATAELPDASTRPTVEVYASIEGTDPGSLAEAGLAMLLDGLARLEAAEFPFAVGDDPETGFYLPGGEGTNGHVWLGDTVTVHTGTTTLDYDEAQPQVMAMTISEAEAVIGTPPDIVASVELMAKTTGRPGWRNKRGAASSSPDGRGSPGGRPLTKSSDDGGGLSALSEPIDAADIDVSTIDHGGLAGLGDDDHPQYTTSAEATVIADAEVATHAAAADPHTGYVLESVMTTPADILVGGTSGVPTRLAKGSDGQVLTVDPTTHLLVWATPAGGALTTKGDILGYSTVAARVPIGTNGDVLTADSAQALGLKWAAPAGGGSIATVDQDISADFTTASDSAWHDITGLTGISLVAGTWLGTIDLELYVNTNLGPVFRIWDGTTTYAQAGVLRNAPVAAVSYHYVFNMQPRVLGSTTTMVIQYYSDTVFTIKKYPTRGGLSTAVATHVTFMKIA